MSDTIKRPAHAPSVTAENFDSVVLKSDTPVVVDFWAPWCGPCRAIGPSIDALSTEYEGRAKVVKLNVDDEAEIETKYGVRSIPTLIFFKAGEPVDTLVGAFPKATIAQKIDALL
jgi:thioredoxin 1